jgi:Flp pilus assembly protein TadG
MTASSKCRRLLQSARGLLAATGANVTVTFALATVPIVGFVGAAVDYSQANSVKAAMQAAADSTALMLSRDAASLNNDQIQSKADAYFKALFTRPEVAGLNVVATYSVDDGSKIKINASTDVKTDFMGLMGFDKLQVAVESQVRWGNSRLRVALVLDVTGSMKSDGKMAAMQTAAKNLLTQLKNAASKNGDVYVAIVPFNKDVAVDQPTSNSKQYWVRWDHWEENTGNCNKSPSRGSYTTKTDCEKNGGKWNSPNPNSWNGCLTDRDQDYDTKNTAPLANVTATKFVAEQYSSCPKPMVGLTYDWNMLNMRINSLQPVGMTNQGIGLAWGFQLLTNAPPPYTVPAKDPNYKYSDVIILMSDGLNTQNRWSKKESEIDARQKITCNNVKAAGITLYTIHVNTENDPKSQLLEDCASTKDKFFYMTSANQMIAAFQQIGTSLSNLRVAK